MMDFFKTLKDMVVGPEEPHQLDDAKQTLTEVFYNLKKNEKLQKAISDTISDLGMLSMSVGQDVYKQLEQVVPKIINLRPEERTADNIKNLSNKIFNKIKETSSASFASLTPESQKKLETNLNIVVGEIQNELNKPYVQNAIQKQKDQSRQRITAFSGGDADYRRKYLKYKTKYVNLKRQRHL